MKKVVIKISDCPYTYVQEGFHHKVYDEGGEVVNFISRKAAIDWMDAWRGVFIVGS